MKFKGSGSKGTRVIERKRSVTDGQTARRTRQNNMYPPDGGDIKMLYYSLKQSETLPSKRANSPQKCRDSLSFVSHPKFQPIWTYSPQFLSGCLQHEMKHLSLLMSCALMTPICSLDSNVKIIQYKNELFN